MREPRFEDRDKPAPELVSNCRFFLSYLLRAKDTPWPAQAVSAPKTLSKSFIRRTNRKSSEAQAGSSHHRERALSQASKET